MSERYWYQDGWLVLAIVVVGFLTLSYWANERQAAYEASEVDPHLDLRFCQQLFGSPKLDCDVWHDRPETLQNVVLIVAVSTDNKEWDKQKQSLVTWQPNRDHQVSLTFPLAKSHLNNPVYVRIITGGLNRKAYLIALK